MKAGIQEEGTGCRTENFEHDKEDNVHAFFLMTFLAIRRRRTMEDEIPVDKKVLEELKRNLTELLGERLKKLVLYGSRARGDYDEDSDIDIAIIVRGLTRELKNQILDMVADIEMEHLTPLSTLVLSEEDFELLKKRERRIALDIEREGIPL